MYTCAQTLVHKRVHTHAHIFRRRAFWIPKGMLVQADRKKNPGPLDTSHIMDGRKIQKEKKD